MRFASDNAASACEEVMAAMAAANGVDVAYDGDAWSRRLNAAFSDLFEAEVEALWVSTGTAANALALACLCPPFGSILCHRDSHIQSDECGAPEFYTHGAKLLTGEGIGGKLAPAEVERLLASVRDDVHRMQPAVLSVTNASEYGLIHTPEELGVLGSLCRNHKLHFHVDGARFANAVVGLGCSPADLTWRVGVDVLSFGFVKNGGLSAEALVFFDRSLAAGVHERRKRGGHLLSKGRYLAAQLLAMIQDDVWLRNAMAANTGADRLAEAAGARLALPVEANELFVRVSREEAAVLRAQGFEFYDWGEDQIRLVVSWDQKESEIQALAEAIRAL